MPSLPSISLPARLLPPIAAVLFLLVFNYAFWQKLSHATAGHGSYGLLIVAVTFVILLLAFTSLLSLFNIPYVIKPVVIALLIFSAVTAYFINSYGAQIDRSMIQNVMETDVREARELLHWDLFVYLLILGIAPAILVSRFKLQYGGWRRHGLLTLGISFGAMVLAAVLLLAFFKVLAPTFRENRELRFLLIPTNYVQAVNGYIKQRFERPVVVAALGTDAGRGPVWDASKRRSVTVLVIGETARAMNFSLNGYGRDTNPLLSKQAGLINFSNVSSCGTATAVSLPCMFSVLGRDRYSDARARSQEGLLDVLRHAGFDVVWLDNNSGCKGTCDRVAFEDLSMPVPNDPFCNAEECYDERLLGRMVKHVEDAKNDLVIVLHQKGSHGPAYWKRYPPQFHRFEPVCKTNELEKCTREEIVAAYDNTIVYTDYLLSSVIRQLETSSRELNIDTSMIYVSDHGESLGEKGLYLHGAPYLISPEEQRKVPMMMWFSHGFAERFRFDSTCVAARSAQPLSHDNLFHTTLGMLDVSTAVYNPALDIFHACSRDS